MPPSIFSWLFKTNWSRLEQKGLSDAFCLGDLGFGCSSYVHHVVTRLLTGKLLKKGFFDLLLSMSPIANVDLCLT